MVADAVRVGAYARAIAATVRPDDVVLDLGCGVGVMSVLAARAGARRVLAVDVDDSVHYARRVVAENGVADRVTFFRGSIADVDLPERPTLLVADVRGPLPLDARAVPAWNGAVARLAPGARTIPRRDVVLAQPVRSDFLASRVHAFEPVEGVRFESVRPALSNFRYRDVEDPRPVAEPTPLFEVRYGRRMDGRHAGSATFRAEVPWRIDGFLVGFEAELAPGVVLRSFGPGRAVAYGTVFLPTLGPVDVPAGGRIGLRVATEPLDDDVVLRWAVDAGGVEGAWQGAVAEEGQSIDLVRARLPGHVPGPDPKDDVDVAILARFGQGQTVEEAVEGAMASLPAGTSREAVERRAQDLAWRRQSRVVRRFGPA
jgi:predicted nicotinamide N-methyase